MPLYVGRLGGAGSGRIEHRQPRISPLHPQCHIGRMDARPPCQRRKATHRGNNGTSSHLGVAMRWSANSSWHTLANICHRASWRFDWEPEQIAQRRSVTQPPSVTLSEAKGLVPVPGCSSSAQLRDSSPRFVGLRMTGGVHSVKKHEEIEFLNSETTATSIKDAGLLQPTAFRHGPGHQAALQGIPATACP